MYNTTNEFQEMALNNARKLAIKATIQTENETYELTVDDIEQGGFSCKDSCMSTGFSLGGVTAKDVTLNLNNRDGKWDNVVLDGATLTVYSGYELSSGIEYVPMGVFIIDKPGRPYSTLEIKAADRLILLDEPLADVGATLPMTQGQLLNRICLYCLIPLSGEALVLPTMSYTVPNVDISSMTCRDAVSEIATMAGGFARMSRFGSLEIVPIERLERSEAHVMPVGSRMDFKQLTDKITITGIAYEDSFWGVKDYILEIEELKLINQSNKEAVLNYIFNKVEGFTYTAYIANYYGNPSLDAGDTVLHFTKDGKDILSFITTHSFKHGGTCTMQADGKSKAEHGYKSANARRIAKEAYKIAGPLEQELTSYQLATAHLNDLIGMMLGVYRTTEELEDGSVKYWFHDLPELTESEIIWGFNGVSLVYSSDGGLTWGGIDAKSDTVVAKAVAALEIRASQIYVDGGNSIEDEIGAVSTSINNLGISVSSNTDSISTLNSKSLTFETRLSDSETQISTLESTADGLRISVSSAQSTANAANSTASSAQSTANAAVPKNSVISAIEMSQESIKISANKINLTGYVTLSSLGQNGSTTIHGDRIESGTLDLTGKITATSGKIGGFSIGTSILSSGSYSNYVVLSSNPSDSTFIRCGGNTYASSPFAVSKDGTVKATKGEIGGWTIQGGTYGSLYNGTAGGREFYVAPPGSSSLDYTIKSTNSSGTLNFSVDKIGRVFCRSIEATGKITSNSDSTLRGGYAGTATTWSGSSVGGSLNSTIGSHLGAIYSGAGSLGGVNFASAGTGGLSLGGYLSGPYVTLSSTTATNIFRGNILYYGSLSKGSDINLKDNVSKIKPNEYIDSLLSLNIKSFTFKQDEKKKPRLGIIAQDFIQNNNNDLIELIVGAKDGYLNIDYDTLYLMNILATQDLNERVKKLEDQLNA